MPDFNSATETYAYPNYGFKEEASGQNYQQISLCIQEDFPGFRTSGKRVAGQYRHACYTWGSKLICKVLRFHALDVRSLAGIVGCDHSVSYKAEYEFATRPVCRESCWRST